MAGAPFDRLYGDLYLCFGQGLRRFEPKSSQALYRGDQEIANAGKHLRWVLIHGRVQGVGFRYFARARATFCGLAGYVRNLPDGEVEVRAAGAQDSLDELVCDLRQGPRMSSVVDCIVEWTGDDTGSFTDLSIRP